MERVSLYLLMAPTMKVSLSKIGGMGAESTFKKMAPKISVNGSITCEQELYRSFILMAHVNFKITKRENLKSNRSKHKLPKLNSRMSSSPPPRLSAPQVKVFSLLTKLTHLIVSNTTSIQTV